jgi:DNA-binding MarR family transcriptional regulator
MQAERDEVDLSSVECVQSLQRTEGLLAGRLNNRFRPYGLTNATFNVLIVMLGAGRSLSPCEIGEQLSVTRGTVTGLLDSLERQHLVRRLPHPEDRRMLLIELTEEGRALLAQLLPEHYRGMADMLACLSEAEKDTFTQVLGKIQDHLVSDSLPST